MSRRIEAPNPYSQQIDLARNLTMDTLLHRLGEPLQNRLVGSVLLLKGESGRVIIDFTPRRNTATPGFFLWREKGNGGSTLDRSSVIFKRNGSLVFVHPGPDADTVSGVKITKKGRVRKFAGPRSSFGGKVLAAKDLAHKRFFNK